MLTALHAQRILKAWNRTSAEQREKGLFELGFDDPSSSSQGSSSAGKAAPDQTTGNSLRVDSSQSLNVSPATKTATGLSRLRVGRNRVH